MKIYIIRHGETKANEMHCLQGVTDWPLNENGRTLAEITGQNMKGIHFDECITSPLLRAKETAEIVLRESGNEDTPIFCDDRIREINPGIWEMKRKEDMPKEVMISYFLAPLDIKEIPEGETPTDVCKRTQAFLSELAARDDDKTYLVSTHGAALRAMLNRLYQNPSDFWQGRLPANCAVSLVEVKDGRPVLTEKDQIFYDPSLCPDQYEVRISPIKKFVVLSVYKFMKLFKPKGKHSS